MAVIVPLLVSYFTQYSNKQTSGPPLVNGGAIYYYSSNKTSIPKDILGSLRSRNELEQKRRLKLAQIWAKLTLTHIAQKYHKTCDK